MEKSNDKFSSENRKADQDFLQKIEKRVSEYEVPFTLSTEEALANVRNRLARKAQIEMPDRHVKVQLIWTSIAASLALLFTIWLGWLRNPEVLYVTHKGEHKSVTLPDGSVATLNAEAEIRFKKRAYKKDRTITLKGEAFFSINKGSAFHVKTDQGTIRVLGTTFNVLARSGRFKVSCLTGKVLVGSGNESEVLQAGESCLKENNQLRKFSDKSITRVTNWREGEFYFEGTPLKIVFEEIERQYNITFANDNFDNRLFTGSFGGQNLTDALDIVCIPMGLSYDIDSSGKVYIRQKGK